MEWSTCLLIKGRIVAAWAPLLIRFFYLIPRAQLLRCKSFQSLLANIPQSFCISLYLFSTWTNRLSIKFSLQDFFYLRGVWELLNCVFITLSVIDAPERVSATSFCPLVFCFLSFLYVSKRINNGLPPKV